MVLGKFQTDKIATAYLVEHIESVFGSTLEHFSVWIELRRHLHYMELDIRQTRTEKNR